MQGIQTVTLAVFLLVTPSNAWWNNGHMITARIAYDELQANNPAVLDKANAILSQLSTKYERDHPFVESATFPDRFKYRGFYELGQESDVNTHGPWHYDDLAYFDGYTPDPKPEIPDINVVHAIQRLKVDIAGGEETDLVSYQLRCLIHYIGDVHQPLHSTSRYTPQFKKGDRGGNSVKLASHDGIKNLHALWDSVVDAYADDWAEPLSDWDWETVGEASSDIRGKYPRSAANLGSLKPEDWAEESLAYAKSNVYPGITEYEWPSDDYISENQKIAELRLAQGGYRLADTLVDLWSNPWYDILN